MSRKKKPIKKAIRESQDSIEPKKVLRHPDLLPMTLTGLIDAFKLNEIPFTYEIDSQYECGVYAGGVKSEINPFNPSEVLEFFKAVVCRL